MKNNLKKYRGNTNKKKKLDKFSVYLSASIVIAISILLFFVFKPKEPPTILSLESYWQKIETSAHDIQQDAVLSNLVIRLKKNAPYAIVAEYNSASVPDESIFVGVEKNGEVSAGWIDLGANTTQSQFGWAVSVEKDKILRKDWAIDSLDALDIFAKNETVSYCLIKDSDSIELSLVTYSPYSVVWMLSLWECPNKEKVETFFMDALTGEIINPYE